MPDESDNLPARRDGRYVSHADLDLMFRIGKAFALSEFFEDAAAEAKAFVIISAGREMGLMPFQSMQAIDVIKGKPVVNANFMAQCVKQHEHYDYRIAELTNERCELTFFHDGVEIGTSTFDTEDAKTAELDRPGRNGQTSMYVKYPRNMLFARAMSNGVAFHCPDALGVRTYVEGELEDEYLETKAERQAARAAERLAIEQAKAAAAGTAPPAEPVAPGEQVIDADPEPEMGTAVQEPMAGTASATIDPDEQPKTTAERLEAHTPEEAAKVAPALSEQEQNIAKIRHLVITELTGEARKECHEAMKYLECWGPSAPTDLWNLFGKKALTWKTLEPALKKAVAAEIKRREKAVAEAAAAAASIPQDPDEPPFGGEQQVEGQEKIIDVEPEPRPEARVLSDEEIEERERIETLLMERHIDIPIATLDELRQLEVDSRPPQGAPWDDDPGPEEQA